MNKNNNYLNFASVVKTIHKYINRGKSKTQPKVIENLFGSFLSQDDAPSMWDMGLISKWFNGKAEISEKLVDYYVNDDYHNKHQKALAEDIERDILPIAESSKIVREIHDVLMRDSSISIEKREELDGCYSCAGSSESTNAAFLAAILCFVMGRPNVEPDEEMQKDSKEGSLAQSFYNSYNKLISDQRKKYKKYAAWKANQITAEKFLTFLGENLRELSRELAVSEVPKGLPVSQCGYDAEKNPIPIFYARCLLMECKLELSCPCWRDTDEQKFYLLKWTGKLRETADNGVNSAVTEQAFIEAVCPEEKPIASLIRTEMYLLSADCHAQLSQLDLCADEEDKNQCYFVPGRKALEAAGYVLETVKKQYGEGSEEYRRLRERWENVNSRFPEVNLLHSSPRAPALRLDTTKKAPPETKLIYSTAFDSAAGQTADMVEAHMLQLAASPNVKIVLQLPQLLDNSNITGTLFHNAGFKALCREGVIVLSSYTPDNGKGKPIIDPKEYVIACLRNRDFHFSASQALNDSEIRKVILNGLIKGAPFHALSLASEFKSELEPIYDAYRSSSELFYPSTVRRYHQDSRCHPGDGTPCGLREEQTLTEIIRNRIELLKIDDERVPVEGRRARLETLTDLQSATTSATTRSAYYSLINQWRKDRVHDGDDLDLFKKVVDQCYGFSSGKRSTDRILNLSSDEVLRIHARVGDEVIDPAGVMAYTVDLAKKRASGAEKVCMLDFENVLRIAKIARRMAAEVDAEKEYWAGKLAEETGLGYSANLSDGVILTECCVKSVYDGSTSHISPRDQEGNGKEFNMEFNTLERGGAK